MYVFISDAVVDLVELAELSGNVTRLVMEVAGRNNC
jgi:hypothetical protein